MATRVSVPQRAQRQPPSPSGTIGSSSSKIPPMHFKLPASPVAQEPEHSLPPSKPSPFHWVHHTLQNLRTTLPLVFADCLGLTASLLIAAEITSFLFSQNLSTNHAGFSLLANGLVFVLLYAVLGLYPGVGMNPIVELKHLVLGSVTSGAALFVLTLAMGSASPAQAVFIASLTLLVLVSAPVFRSTARTVLSRFSWWGHPVLLVGSAEKCEKVWNVLQRKAATGLRPIGFVRDDVSHVNDADWADTELGTIHDIPELSEQYKIFWALIAPSDTRPEAISRTINRCKSIPNLTVIPGLEEFPSLWNRTQDFGGMMGICCRERLLDPWTQFYKRAIDVTAVVFGLTLLSPILLPFLVLTWIWMKICSPGPMFYCDLRLGRDETRFPMWKFRTMVVNGDKVLEDYLRKHPEKQREWDLYQKLQYDPRVIPGIGTFLRKSSLDELPQLWNILVGDMSLVGPRPTATWQTEIYGEGLELFYKVRPGLTGLWQISGRNHTTFRERVSFDAYYVRNWSLWLDIFILGRTVKTVLFREGAF